jgi:hypothetical protein
VLFPARDEAESRTKEPPRKKRRRDDGSVRVDLELDETQDAVQGIVLDTLEESFLIAPSSGKRKEDGESESGFPGRRYDISLIVRGGTGDGPTLNWTGEMEVDEGDPAAQPDNNPDVEKIPAEPQKETLNVNKDGLAPIAAKTNGSLEGLTPPMSRLTPVPIPAESEFTGAMSDASIPVAISRATVMDSEAMEADTPPPGQGEGGPPVTSETVTDGEPVLNAPNPTLSVMNLILPTESPLKTSDDALPGRSEGGVDGVIDNANSASTRHEKFTASRNVPGAPSQKTRVVLRVLRRDVGEEQFEFGKHDVKVAVRGGDGDRDAGGTKVEAVWSVDVKMWRCALGGGEMGWGLRV